MKTILIMAWHGWCPNLRNRIESAFPNGVWSPDGMLWEVENHNLDSFYSNWKDKFMVVSSDDKEILVSITNKSSFNPQ